MNGKVSFRIAQKMEVVKIEIKKWSKEEEKSKDMFTKSLFKDIDTIDRMESEDALLVEELVRKEPLKVELANGLQMEEILWRQKLRDR